MLIDRQNLRAVAWAWLYCVCLVVFTAVLDSLGVTPFVIVPLAIVVLPFLVTLPFFVTRTRDPEGRDA